MICPSLNLTPVLWIGSTWLGVEEIPRGVDGGPVEVPVVVVFLAFGPSSFEEVLDDGLLVKVAPPFEFFAAGHGD